MVRKGSTEILVEITMSNLEVFMGNVLKIFEIGLDRGGKGLWGLFVRKKDRETGAQ